jgi:glycosyltransferase involved in cell wall biosynthesis
MTRFVVVTPVLNGAQFIRDNLASVRAQSDGDWVHYLIDGGSVDGTLEIVTQAAEEDPRIRVVTGKDRSLFDAWFKGFEAATAEGLTTPQTICVWLGCDDLLMPWAFSTLRQQFDQTGAEWIAALPCMWDVDGRLEIVQPFNWYPRRLIRAGQFHNRSLGAMQMESIFFTHGLLSRLSSDTIERIRVRKLAGDFLLWREFSRHAELVPIMTAVAGFRLHGTNLSAVHGDRYFGEIRASGVWLPPAGLARILRAGFRQIAIVKSGGVFRSAWRRFEATLESSPSPEEITRAAT